MSQQQQQQLPREPSGYFPPTKPPNPMRVLSEFAVADTPGTAPPDVAGSDYMACRPRSGTSTTGVGGAGNGNGGSGNGNGMVPAYSSLNSTQQARGLGGNGVNGGAGGRGRGVMSVGTGQRQRRESVINRDGNDDDGDDGGERGDSQGPHGRRRGEVTLEANEADLERKKQQQSVARKQIMDARRKGYDVDGRGQSGPSGRQPRAEFD